MEGELVSDSLSENEGGQYSDTDTDSPFAYTKIFERLCPYYMSIGMTYDEYWNGANELPRMYRKAEELRMEKVNYEAWLQGFYIYEAFCNASPLFHAFAKKGTKPIPYPERPHAITEEEKERDEVMEEKKMMEKGKAIIKAKMMAQMAKKEKRKEDAANGSVGKLKDNSDN
jgi:hypothetical protein